jgi:hypothetical protein
MGWGMRRFALVLAVIAIVPLGAPGVSGAARLAERIRAVRTLPTPVDCPGCWHPGLRVAWQWQLQSPPKPANLLDVRMYDVDGFEAKAFLVAAMHERRIKAVCYLSAGSWEHFRPDADEFPDAVLGKSNGWPGERWLDIRQVDVLGPIMQARLDMCAAKGFDAVEFDNVDGYRNDTGFPLTGAQQLRYDAFLANEAHLRGMSALLKNDLGQIAALLPYFDAALNEQCHQYTECGRLTQFVDAGKPVFGVEYKLDVADFCPNANERNFNFLKKKLALDAWRAPCRGA